MTFLDMSVHVGGRERRYHVHDGRPSNGGTSPVPLVIDLHGYPASASMQAAYSGFHRLATAKGFVVVWPQGVGIALQLSGGSSWNAGPHSCGDCAALREQVDDVKFLRTLVATVSRAYPVDPGRIYATGHSNGCHMAFRLGLEASDIFAAVGCFAGHAFVRPSHNYHPRSFLEVHGLTDTHVLLESVLASYKDTMRGSNSCEKKYTTATVDGYTRYSSVACVGGTALDVLVIPGVGHDEFHYDPATNEINGLGPYMHLPDGRYTSEVVWDFFENCPSCSSCSRQQPGDSSQSFPGGFAFGIVWFVVVLTVLGIINCSHAGDGTYGYSTCVDNVVRFQYLIRDGNPESCRCCFSSSFLICFALLNLIILCVGSICVNTAGFWVGTLIAGILEVGFFCAWRSYTAAQGDAVVELEGDNDKIYHALPDHISS